MSYNLITKAQREAAKKAQFENLLNKGYTQTTYKGLNIFTNTKEDKPLLQVFRDGSSKAVCFYRYSSVEQMEAAIERYKTSYDNTQAYKEERKKNDKLSKAQAEEKAKNGEFPIASVKKTSYLVKKYIQERFDISCSVRSESYTGGSSINISWNLGIDDDVIKAALGELSYGTFDSMTDCAGSRETTPIIVDGFRLCTFRHLFVKQEISKEFSFKLVQMYSKIMTVANAPEVNTEADVNAYFKGGTWGQKFYQSFKVSHFVTQDENKINLIKCAFDYDKQGCYFVYEVDGVQYHTDEMPIVKEVESKEVVQEGRPSKVETVAGEVQIIEYSEKAIAVIGDTKPIKAKLRELGGRFNPRLTCGCGWVFSKRKLQEVTEALTPKEEVKEGDNITFVECSNFNTPVLSGIVKNDDRMGLVAISSEGKLYEVKKLIDIKKEETTLREEIVKTVEYFAETDIRNTGSISADTMHIAHIQDVKLLTDGRASI